MKPDGAALVTGASRGIGRALARELARRGFRVHATMRDPADGAALAAEGLVVERLDVTRPEGYAVPADLRVVVNNAGFDPPYLPVEHAPLALWRETFETNLFAVVAVLRLALPALRANGGGVVCNVTSSSLFNEVPFFAAYRASKAAVGALGESLRAEVAPFGIRVLEVMPGPVATDMLAASDRRPEAAAHAGYAELADALWRGRRAVAPLTASPEAAALRIADAICDDSAPNQVACDALGEAQLAARLAPRKEAR